MSQLTDPTSARAADDSGQSLVSVVLVTALTMVIVTTSVVLSAGNVRPSRETADRMAALAAAQAGTDLFAVALNGCDEAMYGTGDIGDCPGIATPVTRDLVGADGASRATYRWDLLAEPGDNDLGVLRLQVTGRVRDSERVLVTDFRPTPSFLDYLYFTERETVSPDTVARYASQRTVQLPTPAIRQRANRIPSGTTSVTWAGADGAAICDRTWYDDVDEPGRASLRDTGALPLGMDYRERTSSPAGITRYAACEVAFGPEAVMDGKVYSKDAFYFTSSVAGGGGPLFQDDVVTEWGPQREPPPTSGRWYRSNLQVGGDPRSGSEVPQLAVGELSMPAGIDDLAESATCVFSGPTRIRLTGDTAVVTSPGTAPADLGSECVPSGSSGLIGDGLAEVELDLDGPTVFYVESGGVEAPAGPDNLLFDLTSYAIAAAPPGAGANRFYNETGTTAAQLQSAIVAGLDDQSLLELVSAYLLAHKVPPNLLTRTEYIAVASAGTASATDPLLETAAEAVVVQRRHCLIVACLVTPFTDEFKITVGTSTFPLAADVTPYPTGLGTALVEGSLSAPLTIAAEHDVVITGDLTYAAEPAILGLVADADVELYHPVACRTAAPVTAPGGTCPDDITGLYSGGFTGGDFDAYHPSRRYLNLRSDLADLAVSAAVLARSGSLQMQNHQRGAALDAFTLTGGVYQRHRGATGVDWEAVAEAATRERSGYRTTMTYDPRLRSNPPPNFVEPDEALGSGAWQVVGTAEQLGGG